MKGSEFFRRKGVVLFMATLCCALWGSSYPAIKNGYAMFSIIPGQVASQTVFAGYRFFIAGIVLIIYAALSGRSTAKITAPQWRQIGVLGLVQTAIQYIFFYIGVSYTTGTKGSIMNSTLTFFSILLAHFVYKNDRLTYAKSLGCLVGFVGVLIVNFHTSLLDFRFTLHGEGFVVFSAFLLAVGNVYSKKIAQHIDSVTLTAYQLAFGGLVMLIVGYAFGGVMPMPTVKSALLLLYLAIISSVAFALWTILLKYNPVGRISIFNFLIPIFGTVLSGIFLNESILEFRYLVALICVCGGIFLVNRDALRNQSDR